ncbi:MAG: peptide deformylase [Alkalibacterium gilvum]|uniref:Peptide deformylase n=1 Tax=Alkalibacterium gilvum TaxID=1130080 RepID=A0A1H6TVT7_9LACT|nr:MULTISPECIES: peptide deformylase [Alkalibacterium]MDN6735860.1 peptide deformylase [Tetragenococcus koreensis]MDN6293035.1 peptide deformylase [Alkalibacterium sp.]MDN6296294.1 peptide deformylase [Alkalibacterium sp.]SEI81357.1 peptide deformylase [Alkalibacterium gilvum]HAJ69603.1 peptide deformylase [Alkalibacterium sp.]
MLTMKNVIREGHPTLRKVAEPVTLPLTNDEKELAMEMLDFLKNSQDTDIAEKYELRPGVGIAAPQLNVSKRMIAVHVPSDLPEDTAPQFSDILINPRIISHSVKQTCLSEGEGCLSVDREVQGYVPRNKRIRIEYFDTDGNKHNKRLKDFPSIVIQHEIDHLNGIMFFDRIDSDNPMALPKDLEVLGYEEE